MRKKSRPSIRTTLQPEREEPRKQPAVESTEVI